MMKNKDADIESSLSGGFIPEWLEFIAPQIRLLCLRVSSDIESECLLVAANRFATQVDLKFLVGTLHGQKKWSMIIDSRILGVFATEDGTPGELSVSREVKYRAIESVFTVEFPQQDPERFWKLTYDYIVKAFFQAQRNGEEL